MRYKWWMLLGLFAANWFYQIDRALFGVMVMPIQAETGLTDIQIGLCDTVLYAVYACLVPLAGIIGDRFDRSRIIPIVVMVWSAMTAATGLASGFVAFLILRSVATTAPQTFYGPSANALIAHHHERTRTVALSFHASAYYVGLLSSGAIVAGLLGWFGSWRTVYFLFGGAGFLLGLVLLVLMKRETVASGGNAVARPKLLDGFKTFFKTPGALVGASAFMAVVFVNNAYAAWAPKFTAVKFALPPAKAAAGAMFYHHVTALVAILAVGWLSDRMLVRFRRFRMFVMAAALALGAPALVAFGFSPSLTGVWTAVGAWGVMRAVIEANMFANVFDQLPERARSSAVSAMSVFAALLGSLSPFMVGCLSQRYGVRGFEIGFSALGVVGILAAATLTVFAIRKGRAYEIR